MQIKREALIARLKAVRKERQDKYNAEVAKYPAKELAYKKEVLLKLRKLEAAIEKLSKAAQISRLLNHYDDYGLGVDFPDEPTSPRFRRLDSALLQLELCQDEVLDLPTASDYLELLSSYSY